MQEKRRIKHQEPHDAKEQAGDLEDLEEHHGTRERWDRVRFEMEDGTQTMEEANMDILSGEGLTHISTMVNSRCLEG